MKILTYNVSWESMTGKKKDWLYCNNDTDKSNPKFFKKCITNVADVINKNGPYDFVALQEASNYRLLINESEHLQIMKHKIGRSGSENIITFWDPVKYKLIKSINGSFQTGRPWTALIFENNLCFVNIHAGHYHFFALTQKLAELISTLKKYIEINDYRIVIAGDFNNIINENYTKLILSDKKFFMSKKRINTIRRFSSKDQMQFDHVIDSKNIPLKIHSSKVAELSSDHLPIIAILE